MYELITVIVIILGIIGAFILGIVTGKKEIKQLQEKTTSGWIKLSDENLRLKIENTELKLKLGKIGGKK